MVFIMSCIKDIDYLWEHKQKIKKNIQELEIAKHYLEDIINKLDSGLLRISTKTKNIWVVDQNLKKGILLYLYFSDSEISSFGATNYYDKINLKFANYTENDFINSKVRVVPGSIVRKGSYIGKNTVVMPSFVNIGAYIDEGCMIDTWSTIGSCAQIGKNCHISGGVGIGGVLEPIQANPVIIEDSCFIGARSEIVEGVIIGEGSVISMGVYIGASTKIVDRNSGVVTYGYIPPYSVVVPGSYPNSKDSKLPNLYCVVIIKQVDKSTREKTSINELLRD
jgi:2,3,4,5-tetrahydropyridine-2-carboxylate N-succinyltransferase